MGRYILFAFMWIFSCLSVGSPQKFAGEVAIATANLLVSGNHKSGMRKAYRKQEPRGIKVRCGECGKGFKSAGCLPAHRKREHVAGFGSLEYKRSDSGYSTDSIRSDTFQIELNSLAEVNKFSSGIDELLSAAKTLETQEASNNLVGLLRKE